MQEKVPRHGRLKEELEEALPDFLRPRVRRHLARLADRIDGLDQSDKQSGEAGNAEEAVSLAVELRTDIAVIDLRTDARRKSKTLPDTIHVFVLVAHTAAEDLTAVTLTGTNARMHKDLHRDDLSDAVKRLHADEWVQRRGKNEEAAALESTIDRLTPKEKEVLELVRRRYTNAEISSELYITLNTVKHHVTNILRKSGKKRRWDL